MDQRPDRHIRVVGTAGHVDHGKSTLVRALTGIDPDRFEEEKRRGLTIDLGFAWCELPSGTEIGIVDVPGHRRFIRNMLAGTGGIDAALFVVAADEGWRPQSEEHLQILDFLDVTTGVVALTKADLAEEAAAVEEEVRSHLAGSVLAGADIVAVSSHEGEGLDRLRDALDRALARAAPSPRGGRTRLFVDRAFTIAGAGSVVTGTLTGAPLSVGDEVTVLPGGRRARIRGLQTHRRRVGTAVPGSRVAANLAGVDAGEIRRGHVLVTDRWLPTRAVAALLRRPRGSIDAIAERGAYELHVATAQTTVRLKLLDAGAQDAVALVYADTELAVVPGDRFVIRDLGRWQTVAGGIVVDIDPPHITRADTAAIARVRERAGRTGAELAAVLLADRGVVRRDELGPLVGAHDAAPPDAVDTPSFLLDAGHASALRDRALTIAAERAAADPLAPGLAPAELFSALGVGDELGTELVQRWVGEGALDRSGPHLRLPGTGDALPPAQRRTADEALARLREGGASPPSPDEAGLSRELARALERTGELVFVAPGIAYPADVWRDIADRVVELIRAEGPATVSRIREALGTTRRYAVPLLERLDSESVTRRSGDARELGRRAGAG